MTNTFVLNLIDRSPNKILARIMSIFIGSLLLAALAQIKIPLSFSPVPITGQTFGVALISLLWSNHLASLTFILYLAEGAIGLPVFAGAKSGLSIGPTSGYLLGMLVATQIIGSLSRKNFTDSFIKTFFACTLGSISIFSFGLIGLSLFIPRDQILIQGFYPFILGDLLKNISVTAIYQKINKKSG
jgi:biotin transport system substrate-specific component